LCLIQTPPPHPILHSFPTRRSSDLFLVLLVGTQKKGAQRWLTIPGIAQFQPAELAKVAVPAMVAWYFHERQLPASLRDVCLALVITCTPAAFIALQPDLGTALLVAVSGLIVLFMVGLSCRLIALTTTTAAIAATLAYLFAMHDYQR